MKITYLILYLLTSIISLPIWIFNLDCLFKMTTMIFFLLILNLDIWDTNKEEEPGEPIYVTFRLLSDHR